MNALIRQIVVLSVLWAVCEMLLPNGKQQQMVRMTLSVLVMTALLSTAGEVLGNTPHEQPVLAQQAVQASDHSYQTAVLRSAANQAAAFCRQTADRAGYAAEVSVSLRRDGQLDHIAMKLRSLSPLMTQEKLVQMLASQFAVQTERIHVEVLP